MDLGKFLKVFDFVRSAVLPGTLALAGVPQDKIGTIVTLAGDAEGALGPGTGPQKLQYVLDGLQNGMKTAGASDTTIASVSDAATAGIASAFTIAKDVQALHASHVDNLIASGVVPTAAAPAAGPGELDGSGAPQAKG